MARKTTRTGPLRFGLYLRCSTDDQTHKDYSTIDTQRELNTEYVMGKAGIVAGEYADEGKSGMTVSRPQFQRLLRDAQAGLLDAVIVTYMSRLGRGDTFVIAEYLLRETGVTVHMVQEKFTDDLAGYMGKSMTVIMDGVYPKMVSQWTKTKMERMVKAGYHCGGYPAFGYDKVTVTDAQNFHSADKEPPKRLVPHADHAAIVREAYRVLLDMGTVAAVCDYLNTVTARRWNTTSAKNLLTNEVYKGVQQFGQWRNETAHPAIVDTPTWVAAQVIAERQAGRNVSHKEEDYSYYLHGRVFCPHCQQPYTQASAHGRNGRPLHYYTCRSTNSGKSCPIKRINADALHELILREITRAAQHATAMHRLIVQSGGWSGADETTLSLRGEVGKQLQVVEMRINNYVKRIGEGRDSPALLTALDKAEADKQRLMQKRADADKEIARATVVRPTAAQVQAGLE